MSDSSSLQWFGLTKIELMHCLQCLANDLRAGTPALEKVSVVIDNWALARRAVPCLVGITTGHPSIEDGKSLFSSELFYLDEQKGLARSFSRWYRLGNRVEPEFWEKQYPRQP
ncbi:MULTISPECIES: hypothetical protein [unclassified Rhizobium]|uniref:hypothetical protein n=1 Tax=unclassified Rhizobium TaxID=2613769 RepID=UPI001FD92A7B|nr:MULTISPECIES: hypothetical protein [unclassified Rhizobium]MBP2460465.1 hypothetical protein [Rhizobium sp. PvP014]MBP2527862.1 hypothetical protein [Rhizobium sp. PvP099]